MSNPYSSSSRRSSRMTAHPRSSHPDHPPPRAHGHRRAQRGGEVVPHELLSTKNAPPRRKTCRRRSACSGATVGRLQPAIRSSASLRPNASPFRDGQQRSAVLGEAAVVLSAFLASQGNPRYGSISGPRCGSVQADRSPHGSLTWQTAGSTRCRSAGAPRPAGACAGAVAASARPRRAHDEPRPGIPPRFHGARAADRARRPRSSRHAPHRGDRAEIEAIILPRHGRIMASVSNARC